MAKKRLFTFVVIALVALPVFGYSGDKPNWGDEKNGFILQDRKNSKLKKASRKPLKPFH